MRNRTIPGKYMLGSWQSLEASDAQKVLQEEVIATQRLMVVRCVYKEGSNFSAHVHQQEQITIVESGSLEFMINSSAVQVGPGQMISVFPGVLHTTRVVGDEPARALNIFHAAAEAPEAARTGKLSHIPRAERI